MTDAINTLTTTSSQSPAAPVVQELLHHPCWCQAFTLTERLATLRVSREESQPTRGYNVEQAMYKLKQWREQKPFDTDTYFADRLMMDDITEDDLLLLLGEPIEAVQKRASETPGWLIELARAFECRPSSEISPLLPGTDNPNRVPSLLDSVEPLLRNALERLKAGIVTLATTYTTPPFDPDTIATLLFAQLPDLLLAKMSRTLALELNVARVEGRLQGDTPEERFHDFVQNISRKEGILPLLEEYSSLARILVEDVENWVNYRLEFLQHLCTDWNEICQAFTPDKEPGMLVEVDSGVGDLHKRGRSILRLKFDSGFQLVYKPKSMTIDVHFQELLEWLNERGNYPAFRRLNVIDKRTYGWSEFVMAQECNSKEEVARFYERQGAYLALLYALEATDVHFENLIAAGEHPMLIDLEALFHPRVEGHTLTRSETTLSGVMQYSVLRVGLLPQRIWGKEITEGVDVSGLGGQKGQFMPRPVPRLADIGTDHMCIVRQQIELPARYNRPTLAGKDMNVLDYCDQMLDGFKKMYRLLMKYREELLAGPLENFAHDEVRLIVRHTRLYGLLLSESYHPHLLRNALDRDLFFDRLWLNVERQPYLRRVIAAERADLHAGDIPMFTTRPDIRAIYTSQGECIADFFDEPSMESVRKILSRFDERDLARQCWFIEATLATIPIGNGHIDWKRAPLVPSQTRVTYERLLKAACAVGNRLCEQVLQGEEGEANWIGLTCISDYVWRLLPAGIDLYNGASGIALFLAYLGAITGETRYSAVARAALVSIQKQVEGVKGYLKSLGAFEGWGSLIYLYSHLGMCWNAPELFRQAEEIVKLLPMLIEEDDALDMISGAAGCISCLLCLYQVTRSPYVLAIAVQCGHHLAANTLSPRKGTGQRATTVPLTGFSHGVAGYALSLLRLAALNGEERFRQAAIEAMAYERNTFSPEKQNWPDLRDLSMRVKSEAGDGPHYMVTWCHGAAGIGLARLASLPYLDDDVTREEIAIALKTTLTQGFKMNHSLCHGDLGNLEVLLAASRVLNDPQYREHVDDLSAVVLNSIETYGWYTGVPLSVETPGLMTGIAGIGYELLRLAEPEKVPSVLVLAPPAVVLQEE